MCNHCGNLIRECIIDAWGLTVSHEYYYECKECNGSGEIHITSCSDCPGENYCNMEPEKCGMINRTIICPYCNGEGEIIHCK